MRVIIVGAGIGGLVTALQLHQQGIKCAIYERNEPIRELGVGINLLPHAVAELAELDLLDRLTETGIRTRELIYTTYWGLDIRRDPCGTYANYAHPQISIHRGRLQALLLRAVQERLGHNAVRTGHQLRSFDQDADGVHADFVDPRGNLGPAAHGDVLVGADGIHSTVRAQLFPEEGPPLWNGVTLWRGTTEWPEFLGGRRMIVAGGKTKIVVYPIGNGQTPDTQLTNWAVCLDNNPVDLPRPGPHYWSHPADPAELLPHIEHFAIPGLDHIGLIQSTKNAFVVGMCDRNPLRRWSHDRVTLLGDAAHPMYPMGSNGAAQAILDSRSLAHNLARYDDPADALQAYQHERLPATTNVVLQGRLGGPERVINYVEHRAQGRHATTLTEIDVNPAELDAIVNNYTRIAGNAHAQANNEQ